MVGEETKKWTDDGKKCPDEQTADGENGGSYVAGGDAIDVVL
mgnify:CR=1 FL=1